VLESDEFHITRGQSLQNDDTANTSCMENAEDAGILVDIIGAFVCFYIYYVETKL